MKKTLQNVLLIIVLCSSVFLLTSCAGGIKGSDAKAHINEFFAAIVNEDYSKAESLLHPDFTGDLERFFASFEKAKGVDFQEGIDIKIYNGFRSALYDSEVDGAKYELTMQTKVGEKAVEFTIGIVKNDAGYGIYYIILDTK